MLCPAACSLLFAFYDRLVCLQHGTRRGALHSLHEGFLQLQQDGSQLVCCQWGITLEARHRRSSSSQLVNLALVAVAAHCLLGSRLIERSGCQWWVFSVGEMWDDCFSNQSPFHPDSPAGWR